MNWTTVREKLAGTQPNPKISGNHYLKTIRDLVEAGFKLATPEIEAIYTGTVGDYNQELGCWPYFEVRESTYPIISKTMEQNGLFAYGTHDRSEDVSDAIDVLSTIHIDDIEAGRAWLMPVRDDDEYVSWDFDIAVGTEQEVIEKLQAAAPAVKASLANYGQD